MYGRSPFLTSFYSKFCLQGIFKSSALWTADSLSCFFFLSGEIRIFVCVSVCLRSPVDADGSAPVLRRSHFPATVTPPNRPLAHFTKKNLIYFPWASGKIIIISIFLLRLSSVKLTARGVYLTVTRGGWRLEADGRWDCGLQAREGVGRTMWCSHSRRSIKI